MASYRRAFISHVVDNEEAIPQDVAELCVDLAGEKFVVLQDTEDSERRMKGVGGVQAITETVFADMPGENTLIIMTASPATPFTVRAENAESRLAPEVYSNPKSFDTVQARWATMDAVCKADHNVVIAAPKAAWDKLEKDQQDVWKGLSQKFSNVVGVQLDGELPPDINGALNIVGSEVFSINAGQAQASQWRVDESGASAPFVKEVKLWFGDAAKTPEVQERAESILKILKNQSGKHHQKLENIYERFGLD